MLHSSKLAAVLRKLHNANDMIHSSAYESIKPNLPIEDETSVTQSSPTASNVDTRREEVEAVSETKKEAENMGVDSEPATHESPVGKVT